jgi:hypothetical protein
MNAADRQLRRDLSDGRVYNPQHLQPHLLGDFRRQLGLGVAEPSGFRLAVLIEPEQYDGSRRGCLDLGLSMFMRHD